MFNFADLVSDILLEQEPTEQLSTTAPSQVGGNDVQKIMSSAGFKELVNAYTAQYNVTPNANDVLKAVNIITGGKYIAAKYTNLGYVPFIDAFAQVYALIDDKNKSNYTQSDIINAIIQSPEKFDPIFNNVASVVKTTASVSEYEPSNPDVNRAWRSLTSEMDKLSQVAIQSLGSDTVHSAIIKIIAKRVPILDRIMGLKGLVKPFNASVITPILYQFKKYTGYKQGDFQKNPGGWLKDRLWTKKVPQDFNKLVENVSANNLLNVAVLAYEYYIHLLRQKYLTDQRSESINDFNSLYNEILLEMPLKSATQIGQEIAKGERLPMGVDPELNKWTKKQYNKDFDKKLEPEKKQLPALNEQQIEKISNQIGNVADPDYESFLNKGTSQFLPGIKYDLSTIAKDPSREAKDLYKALTGMAYFVRTRLSAAQRIERTAGALGALRTGMGPVG